MKQNLSRCLVAFALLLASGSAMSKPIAWADGWTLMSEYGAGTMTEAQVFYAPTYWASLGAGWVNFVAEDDSFDRRISYVRGNLLAKRWNLPAAQANVFAWGGVGRATGNEFRGAIFAHHYGFQADYETRKVYVSWKSDAQVTRHFEHRTDTLQLGIAPYEHDYDTLATWFLVQARHYTGGIYDGVEPALILRLFKGGSWLDIGATSDGKLQAMLMFVY